MKERHTAYLGLGSNLGRRLANLRRAVQRLEGVDGVFVRESSAVYESEAHKKNPGDQLSDFLNLVLRIETWRSPHELLDECLALETAEGRDRSVGSWLPRTIDIDILAFADQVLQSERLKVPHPRMAERRFVLLPFADIAPEFKVPEPFSATVSELLSRCTDSLPVIRRYRADAVRSNGGIVA